MLTKFESFLILKNVLGKQLTDDDDDNSDNDNNNDNDNLQFMFSKTDFNKSVKNPRKVKECYFNLSWNWNEACTSASTPEHCLACHANEN